MKEVFMTLRAFVEEFLYKSSTRRKVWTLKDGFEFKEEVAYLAQHPLVDQITSLRHDICEQPLWCGKQGPSQIYLWIGTGGTRTPLHYDSDNNLLVQLVGARYVRLYESSQSAKLYVNADRSSSSAYGGQGNMSPLNCENEDWSQHPEAESAVYTEVLLFPGDCLYIPARTWHYVRSLSCSMSVSYWF